MSLGSPDSSLRTSNVDHISVKKPLIGGLIRRGELCCNATQICDYSS